MEMVLGVTIRRNRRQLVHVLEERMEASVTFVNGDYYIGGMDTIEFNGGESVLINVVHSSVESGILHMGSIELIPLLGRGVGSENAEKG